MIEWAAVREAMDIFLCINDMRIDKIVSTSRALLENLEDNTRKIL